MGSNDEYIKDYQTKKILGVLRTESNGDIKAYSFPAYQWLGIYIKAQNITCEVPSYRKVSDGNSVVNFIYQFLNK